MLEPENEKRQFFRLIDLFPSLSSMGPFDRQALYEDFLLSREEQLAEPIDYLKYAFWKKPKEVREQFFTRRQYAALCEAVNDPAQAALIRDKAAFTRRLSAYLNRDALVIDPSDPLCRHKFDELCGKHHDLVAKDCDSGYGKGVRMVSVATPEERDALWADLVTYPSLLEERMVQHPVLSELFPGSINSVRVVTATDPSRTPLVVGATIRCGRGTMTNDSGEGLFATIDPATGQVRGKATSHYRDHCSVHPDTHVPFDGLQIPNWEGLLAQVSRVAQELPGLRLVNWDWACLEAGEWALVEGNTGGGIGPCQEAADAGLKSTVEAILLEG